MGANRSLLFGFLVALLASCFMLTEVSWSANFFFKESDRGSSAACGDKFCCSSWHSRDIKNDYSIRSRFFTFFIILIVLLGREQNSCNTVCTQVSAEVLAEPTEHGETMKSYHEDYLSGNIQHHTNKAVLCDNLAVDSWHSMNVWNIPFQWTKLKSAIGDLFELALECRFSKTDTYSNNTDSVIHYTICGLWNRGMLLGVLLWDWNEHKIQYCIVTPPASDGKAWS